jgi:sucrose-6F-phosphate phosphohydrolase
VRTVKNIKLVLATDLDGTFLHGETAELYDIITSRRDELFLIFLTGRSLELTLPILETPSVPRPDVLVADVGATIVHGSTLEPFRGIQAQILSSWPGEDAIKERLRNFPHLRYQEQPQHNRVSYFTDEHTDLDSLEKIVTDELGCSGIHSHNYFFDVLPRGVSKGSTLQLILEASSLPYSSVMVAGDSLNDLTLFQIGCSGVIVANSEKGLIQALKNQSTTYLAKGEGARGILEGLSHFKLL